MTHFQNSDHGYSTKEICSIFSIHKSTVRRWVDAGLLPYPIKIGRSVRFMKSEIDQIIDDRKAERVAS